MVDSWTVSQSSGTPYSSSFRLTMSSPPCRTLCSASRNHVEPCPSAHPPRTWSPVRSTECSTGPWPLSTGGQRDMPIVWRRAGPGGSDTLAAIGLGREAREEQRGHGEQDRSGAECRVGAGEVSRDP